MKPHVLIVEDNFLLSEHLIDIVKEELAAVPLTATRVSVALGIIPDDIVLAFLDIDVADGKTYPAARKLIAHKIPFIFVSGNEPSSLPDDLKNAPFLSKPVVMDHLVDLAKTLTSAFDIEPVAQLCHTVHPFTADECCCLTRPVHRVSSIDNGFNQHRYSVFCFGQLIVSCGIG